MQREAAAKLDEMLAARSGVAGTAIGLDRLEAEFASHIPRHGQRRRFRIYVINGLFCRTSDNTHEIIGLRPPNDHDHLPGGNCGVHRGLLGDAGRFPVT
jgi:hypothetical protein